MQSLALWHSRKRQQIFTIRNQEECEMLIHSGLRPRYFIHTTQSFRRRRSLRQRRGWRCEPPVASGQSHYNRTVVTCTFGRTLIRSLLFYTLHDPEITLNLYNVTLLPILIYTTKMIGIIWKLAFIVRMPRLHFYQQIFNKSFINKTNSIRFYSLYTMGIKFINFIEWLFKTQHEYDISWIVSPFQ